MTFESTHPAEAHYRLSDEDLIVLERQLRNITTLLLREVLAARAAGGVQQPPADPVRDALQTLLRLHDQQFPDAAPHALANAWEAARAALAAATAPEDAK